MNFNNLNQLYRSVIMDHYKSPRNKGTLDNGSMTVDMKIVGVSGIVFILRLI